MKIVLGLAGLLLFAVPTWADDAMPPPPAGPVVYGFFTWRIDGEFDGWWYTDLPRCKANQTRAAKHPAIQHLTPCIEIRGEPGHGVDEHT